MLTPPHDLLQASALFIGQPPRPYRLSHLSSQHSTCHHKIECESITAACQPTRRTFVATALDEANLDTPVSLEVGHEPSHVVYCPRCTGVLGMLLIGEDGVHLLGCAVGFIISCTFCRWPVSPRLMSEPKWERHYGAFWDYYDRVVSWPRYAAAIDTQDSQPEIS